MFGMGGSEIIVILIVALLFLGPDKLPQAAKSLSKGIRDIKKQSRSLQQQIESDEQIGGAIRDLKSALRGEDLPAPRKPFKPRKALADSPSAADAIAAGSIADGASAPTGDALGADPNAAGGLPGEAAGYGEGGEGSGDATTSDGGGAGLTMPATAGEPAPATGGEADDGDLAAMVKPAPGTVAKGT